MRAHRGRLGGESDHFRVSYSEPEGAAPGFLSYHP